jgi:hypothetical protein
VALNLASPMVGAGGEVGDSVIAVQDHCVLGDIDPEVEAGS